VDAIQTAYVEWLAGQIGTVMLPTSQHGKRLHLGAQLEDIFTPPTFMTAQGTCSCTKLFENRPLIAFTGTLGSGKSMMLRYCAWIACQAVITQTFASTQNILGLPTTNQTAVPLPLLFPISEFAHRPPEKQALGLWAFMTDYLAKQSNIEHLAELLEGLFQHSRPLLFLLDGLDEIAEPQKLEEVRQELHSLLIGRANVYAAVTYRSSALPYINLRSDFYPYTIQGLSNAERQPFLQQTIKALSKNNTSTNVTEKATVFWEKLQRVLHQRIRNRGKHAPILEDNPLFLHTFLSLYLNTDNLRRFDRFDALTYLLILASYHWHDPTKLKIQGFIGSGVDTYIGILQKIAFESYFQEEEITEPWLLKILQQDGEGGRYAPYIERFLHV
ncbi:MAG: NACHT domain-containing protein, partial [Anaerolineales bacterium]|nr:NACHT domain-containing protein [Anaerolineales bacterium]